MKKKTLFSMLGLAFCSIGLTAQTYKLHDMTQSEFEKGGNQYFSFSEYRLASGAYSPLTLYTDSGRVNWFDVFLPEYFQGQAMGVKSENSVGADRSWYDPLWWSWSNKKVNLVTGKSNDASSFMYVSRINDKEIETYPTLLGTVALEFTVPEEGYYKVTSTAIREDGRYTPEDYLMAKFRFRQDGEKLVDQSATLGFDYAFGSSEDSEVYDYGDIFKYYKTIPTSRSFYVYVKGGDIITAESDLSHKMGTANFMDSTNYWARDGWGRTRWLQFEAEKVSKETAEASEDYVNPYDDEGGYLELFRDLFEECSVYSQNVEVGINIGQFDQEDKEEFENKLQVYGTAAGNEDLLSFTAKVYYNKLSKLFEEFKKKAHTIDFSLPENSWLFQIPESSLLYPAFEKQFDKTDTESPWDFKSYTVSSGIYNPLANFGLDNMSGQAAWYDGAKDWFYIAKNGSMHPTIAKSPVITFKAVKDGLYHAATTVQRDKANKNKNYMYTRYRFVKGGIQDGLSSVSKGTFMFADAYGNADNNVPVSRDFYVNLKAGDVITFEEDCYTANSNGSGATTWTRLMVLQVAAEKADSTINANVENYCDPYAIATDFREMDSVINVVSTKLATSEFTDDLTVLGKYPNAAKWEIDDAMEQAKDLRNAGTTTQFEMGEGARALSAAYARFLTTLIVRYENAETLASGAYYIEKDGLFLTVDSVWTTGTALATMYPHFQSIMEPTKVKNNQVFDVEFNATPGLGDPSRYSIHCCLKGQTWENGGAYHITEKGEIREGDITVAQNDGNKEWRNHSLIYDGTRWCMYSVKNKVSLVFDTDPTKFTAMTPDKKYIYRLVPIDKIDIILSVQEVNADKTGGQIVAVTVDGGVELYCTQEVAASVYNAAGGCMANVQLSNSATKVALPSGFYVVKAVNGVTAKMIVK